MKQRESLVKNVYYYCKGTKMTPIELANNVLDLKESLSKARKVSKKLAAETTYQDLVKSHHQIVDILNRIQEFILRAGSK